MRYSELVEIYEKLGNISGRIEKVGILSEFLKKISGGDEKYIYLIKGKVVADYDARELGISGQLAIKAIAKALGVDSEKVVGEYRKVGDFGDVAEKLIETKKQRALFSEKLNVEKVYNNIRKLLDMEGKGSVDKKLGLIADLLGSANGKEAKYIVRTLLGDLRIGVADGVIRDAVSRAFFDGENVDLIQKSYDLSNDWELIIEKARSGVKELGKVGLIPGRPMNVMLPVKVTSIEEGFNAVGKPCALEHKYDGFRVVINKSEKGEIKLFTRRLEDVTKQFPDVVSAVKKYIKGKSFILDSEVVGYDSKTGKYTDFQHISQRIKRKYDIEKLIEKLPVEINVFDVVYYDGESVIDLPFKERRKIVEKIVEVKERVARPSKMKITGDLEEAEKFYEGALDIGEEGIMMKNLDAPYQQGRRVGFMVKMKPEMKDLDLVIVGAEYGAGKRGGWLSSYIVACEQDGEFLEVGKVSSGLKEIEQEGGTTYEEMTNILKKLIESEEGNFVRVVPKIVVSVTYQNIQRSTSYKSGYALRFPRITAYRPDKKVEEIASLDEIEKEAKRMERK